MTHEETTSTLIHVAQELGTAQMLILNALADDDILDPEMIEDTVIIALRMLLEEIDGPASEGASSQRDQLLAAVVRYQGPDE